MPGTFTYTFDTPSYKGTTTLHTGLFINGEWVDPVEESFIDDINPVTSKVITKFSAGSAKDVDKAVEAARKAYKTSWGRKATGKQRARLLGKLADLMEEHKDELAALDCLDTGKLFVNARDGDLTMAIDTVRYYAGWADKIEGETIEVSEEKFAYTRREPFGVVGQIIPWNFPMMMFSWKIAPALATGNTIVMKPSELTPLSALRFCDLVVEAGFPPGVFNLVNGYGNTVGQAISEHPNISKVAFTGSTLVGRKILEASARTNLKVVTLELGGKAPNIIFDDANLAEAAKWSAFGVFVNQGQTCTAGSRIFVQESIYDQFMAAFTQLTQSMQQNTGDPFAPTTQHGPQVSQTQFDRVMGYIESGKADGASLLTGGQRHGSEGYFIEPTIFTDVKPEMKIYKEEIFGPVASIIKFKDEAEVIEMANSSSYGLSAALYTENVSRAIRVSNEIEAGTIWVNLNNITEVPVPFGGYKQSGIGRELGKYAIETYTQVKGVHIRISPA